jgi:hypothetical protein
MKNLTNLWKLLVRLQPVTVPARRNTIGSFPHQDLTRLWHMRINCERRPSSRGLPRAWSSTVLMISTSRMPTKGRICHFKVQSTTFALKVATTGYSASRISGYR